MILRKPRSSRKLLNNSEFGPSSWPEWPKILSPELFSPKWLKDLPRTERGRPSGESSREPEIDRAPGLRTNARRLIEGAVAVI